jgi:hypothetical protein
MHLIYALFSACQYNLRIFCGDYRCYSPHGEERRSMFTVSQVLERIIRHDETAHRDMYLGQQSRLFGL